MYTLGFSSYTPDTSYVETVFYWDQSLILQIKLLNLQDSTGKNIEVLNWLVKKAVCREQPLYSSALINDASQQAIPTVYGVKIIVCYFCDRGGFGIVI